MLKQSAFKEKWDEHHNQLSQLFYKLTEEDIKDIDGDVEKFVGIVQQRYQVTGPQAETMTRQLLGKIDDVDESS